MPSETPLPTRPRRRWTRWLGLALVLLGLVLLGASLAYFLYGFKARSDVQNLKELESLIRQRQTDYVPLAPKGTPELGELALAKAGGQTPTIQDQPLYPGEAVRASYWANPLAYEPPSSLQASLVQGFDPPDQSLLGEPGTREKPTRIRIPAIDVDSRVEELSVLDLGDSRAYETPRYVVGHIPETARPGERGTGWYFGHLESPIRGEGSVFRDLPRIPELLRQGDEVYVVVTGGGTDYLYRVTDFQVLHESQLRLTDLGRPTAALVTCIPRLYYDYRLVVLGELAGTRKAGS